jgi:lipoprotein-anchoring transpeptidase ErfK/SrfK
VTWSPAIGATAYEVYRAALPSAAYERIGTTKNTYFADNRKGTLAYSYKVKPLFGNVAGKDSRAVTLWSDVPGNVLPDESLTSATGILLLVNKKAQVTTAYAKDGNGKYTIVLRHMICSTGRVYERTPVGEFKITSKMGQWYRYPSGIYIRYPSVYKSDLYFHSVLYSSAKKIQKNAVANLGTRQSLGCIRLKVTDAQWVYDNCPNGTSVSIVDGKSISALSKALRPKNLAVR